MLCAKLTRKSLGKNLRLGQRVRRFWVSHFRVSCGYFCRVDLVDKADFVHRVAKVPWHVEGRRIFAYLFLKSLAYHSLICLL